MCCVKGHKVVNSANGLVYWWRREAILEHIKDVVHCF